MKHQSSPCGKPQGIQLHFFEAEYAHNSASPSLRSWLRSSSSYAFIPVASHGYSAKKNKII
jgi:hypothetical protein